MSWNLPAITAELHRKVKSEFSCALDPAMDFAAELAFLGLDYPLGGETIYITRRNGMNIFPIPTDPEIARIRLPRKTSAGNIIAALHFCPLPARILQTTHDLQMTGNGLPDCSTVVIEQATRAFLATLRETRSDVFQTWFGQAFAIATGGKYRA
ncbi:hypothetical protein LJR030_002867 [Rhizobium sp. LjRoot30]|uniref:hypothetical protein n=1 Tax=Rhizobium sp. LjRoot30 TaxID=3342320 RepID=UPI003ECF145E